MRKQTFTDIINAFVEVADIRLLDDYSSFDDEKIKSCDALHFEFVQLNMQDDRARKYNKRFTVKANTFVVNQTVAQYIADSKDYTVKRHYIASSKNYADITNYSNLVDMFCIVRNAHYESIAQALENAIDIEFKTQAKRKTSKAEKNA